MEMEKTLKHWFWVHGIVFGIIIGPLFFIDKPEQPTAPVTATIDCDMIHTIPNLPDSVLKQCERMKIK